MLVIRVPVSAEFTVVLGEYQGTVCVSAVEATMHSVAVEVDLMQPRRTVGSVFDQCRQLGRDEAGRGRE